MKEILNTKIRDWRIGQGDKDVSKEDRDEYTLKMSLDESSGQLYFDVDNGTPKGLTGVLEINLGRPCVHLGVEMDGDNLIHVFGVEKGLVVTSESTLKGASRVAEPDRYSYNSFNGTLYLAE